MATHISAEKRNRQNEKRRTHNRWIRSRVKAASKTVVEACDKNDPKSAKDALIVAMRELNKAGTKGIIHKRAASRKIARLSKRLTKIAKV